MSDQVTLTREQKAALGVIKAVADTIQELGSVPSGHLYAQLMGHLSLNNYQTIISMLVRGGLVRQDGSHLLTWVGGK